MLLLRKLKKNMDSVLEHLEIGIKAEESKPSGHLAAKGSIGTPTLLSFFKKKSPMAPAHQEPKFAMSESALLSTSKSLISKSKILGKRSRATKSSPKLPVDSISRGHTLTPFWTESSKEISNNWLSPIGTDYVALDSNSSSEFVRPLVQKSWFSAQLKIPKETSTAQNCQKICSASSRCLSQKIMDTVPLKVVDEKSESEKPMKKRRVESKKQKPQPEKDQKLPAGKAIKVRLYPNSEQKSTLAKWFGTARWTYNKCLDVIEKEKVPKKKKDLRAKCLNSENFTDEKTKWVLETPYDIRDEAMNDLLKAYTSTFARGDEKFKMKYKTKKDPTQSIAILNKHYGKPKRVYSFLANIKSAERLPSTLDYDSRLIMNRLGHYYFCIPKPLQPKLDNQQLGGIVAMDPGVRTFQTCYDGSGLVAEFGKNDIGRIYRLCHYHDDLQSRWSQPEVNHKKRYRMKKAALRINLKIRNLVDELHKKLSNWLLTNYQVILLPKFETSKMIRRGQRRIRSKTARAMVTWSHYKFQQRLLSKAREYPNCRVYIVTEEYTSKTCGSCGHLHQKLGGNKKFKCPNARCKTICDRDVNGARNILLKFLTDNNESGVFSETSRIETLLLHDP